MPRGTASTPAAAATGPPTDCSPGPGRSPSPTGESPTALRSPRPPDLPRTTPHYQRSTTKSQHRTEADMATRTPTQKTPAQNQPAKPLPPLPKRPTQWMTDGQGHATVAALLAGILDPPHQRLARPPQRRDHPAPQPRPPPLQPAHTHPHLAGHLPHGRHPHLPPRLPVGRGRRPCPQRTLH
ncbi:hypothetical protein SGPA1_80066 [Streptomyces misionensis JCM 4497]